MGWCVGDGSNGVTINKEGSRRKDYMNIENGIKYVLEEVVKGSNFSVLQLEEVELEIIAGEDLHIQASEAIKIKLKCKNKRKDIT